MKIGNTSIALCVVMFCNFVTFYLIFPADYFSGEVYAATRRYGLNKLLQMWATWLFLSTIVIPILLWLRAMFDARRREINQPKTIFFIDCALVVSWIVVFWTYIVFRTPFLIYLAARLGT